MRKLVLAGAVVIVALLAATAIGSRPVSTTADARSRTGLTRIQQRLLSGTASTALDESAAARQSVGAAAVLADGFQPTSATGCPTSRGSNVRVNQECQNLTDPDLAGRGQAQNETFIAQDRYHSRRLVASSNDYRRGDGNCYAYVSGDRGATWHDATVPMSFTRGTAFGSQRQYWGGGGDTSVAFDTKGNAYLSCQVFNRGTPVSSNPDLSSAFYVFRSPGRTIDQGGANWTFPGRPVAEAADVAGTGNTDFLDKQLLAVDDHRGSPFQDRVYVTWTTFAPDGTGYIYEAYSSDYGETFSAPVLVSSDSPLCTNTYDVPTPQGRCNENQFSQPFTGPDGALYVAFANYNNETAHMPGEDEGGGGDDGDVGSLQADDGDNHNQMLLAKSTDGGKTFSAPVKVADYYELPDCVTYQNANEGRACVPEKGETANSVFRASNYPAGAVDPKHPDRVVVTFGSYINRHSNEANGCVPQGFNPDTGLNLFQGVKTPGACNNDIVVSRSGDGGQTFTGTTADPRELPAVRRPDRHADQWFQWADFSRSGRLMVDYYDRAYGDDELTGYSDFSVSGASGSAGFDTTRATTSSMPPPSQFQGTFWGDYTGLAVADGVHPIWSDTRDPELFTCPDDTGKAALPPSTCTGPAANAPRANDQNAYSRSMQAP